MCIDKLIAGNQECTHYTNQVSASGKPTTLSYETFLCDFHDNFQLFVILRREVSPANCKPVHIYYRIDEDPPTS